MVRILVIGETGQVARELAALSGGGLEVQTVPRAHGDLAEPGAVAEVIARAAGVQAVINAAAYTAVDKAETELALAMRINGEAPGEIARACAARGLPLVHISTDYVFDGSGNAARGPQAEPAPINAYGRSKRAGELAVAAAGGVQAVLRTSWVFSAHGGNFVKTMLRLGAERDELTIVDDQIGGPTAAADIAAACVSIAEALRADPAKSGLYHFSGAPDVSWAGFAREIFAQAGLACAVTPIATVDYPTPAARPLNSRLDCGATEAAFGLPRPDWRTGLADVLCALSLRNETPADRADTQGSNRRESAREGTRRRED